MGYEGGVMGGSPLQPIFSQGSPPMWDGMRGLWPKFYQVSPPRGLCVRVVGCTWQLALHEGSDQGDYNLPPPPPQVNGGGGAATVLTLIGSITFSLCESRRALGGSAF